MYYNPDYYVSIFSWLKKILEFKRSNQIHQIISDIWSLCKNGQILILKYFSFQAHMKFPPDYPYSPPSVRFITKVWHPNVYEVRNNYEKQKNSSNFQNPNIWTDLLIVTLFVFTSKIALGLKDWKKIHLHQVWTCEVSQIAKIQTRKIIINSCTIHLNPRTIGRNILV